MFRIVVMYIFHIYNAVAAHGLKGPRTIIRQWCCAGTGVQECRMLSLYEHKQYYWVSSVGVVGSCSIYSWIPLEPLSIVVYNAHLAWDYCGIIGWLALYSRVVRLFHTQCRISTTHYQYIIFWCDISWVLYSELFPVIHSVSIHSTCCTGCYPKIFTLLLLNIMVMFYGFTFYRI